MNWLKLIFLKVIFVAIFLSSNVFAGGLEVSRQNNMILFSEGKAVNFSTRQTSSTVTDNLYTSLDSQSIIKKYKLQVNIHADTAGSAKYISENKKENEAAISSTLSAKIYKLEIIKRNIEDEEGNITRFLIMGKKIEQPELKNKKYITSCLFKLKSKPAALYSALSGFAIQGVNLTKLQSYPEKNSFTSYFFLCDLDGHIEETKIQKSLEELGLHCEDFHVLGVYEADKFRNK